MTRYYNTDVLYTNTKMSYLIVNEDVSTLFTLFHNYFPDKNVLCAKLEKLLNEDYISSNDTILTFISKLMYDYTLDGVLLKSILIILKYVEEPNPYKETKTEEEEVTSPYRVINHISISTT